MKKVLLTGGNGMLGSDIIPVLSENFEIFATNREILDITDYDRLREICDTEKPDWIFHLAALTDLDFCEKEPDAAMKVNGEATGEIAKVAGERNISMLYISTSGVFPGSRQTPYTEDDTPDPVSVYGKSKLLGETLVDKYLSVEDYLILRAGWLFGGGKNDIKFVGKIYKLMMKLDEVKVVTDIYGSPNYSKDIGEITKFLIGENARGIYHTVNEGIASRYDIAVKIKEFSGLEVKVNEATANDFPTVAPRPPMEGILNKKLMDNHNYRMRRWEDALSDYILRLKNNSISSD